MKKRLLAILIIFVALASLPTASLAYTSKMCTGEKMMEVDGKKIQVCTKTDVGPFLMDISKECGNTGTCTLEDIMRVFINVSKYIIGIVGAVVLLMYVIGGIYLMTSGARPANRQKGKDYIRISTVGLLIVFLAFTGIEFITKTISGGRIGVAENTCIGKEAKAPCGSGQMCDGNGFCISSCSLVQGDTYRCMVIAEGFKGTGCAGGNLCANKNAECCSGSPSEIIGGFSTQTPQTPAP